MGEEKLFAKNGEFHSGFGWKDLTKLIDNCSPNKHNKYYAGSKKYY
jgi:hypothetical protein